MTKIRSSFSFKKPSKRTVDMDSVEQAALLDEDCPKVGTPLQNDLAVYSHMALSLRIEEGTQKARTAWEKHREIVLPRWIEKHPGTRPVAWWRFEAPAHEGVGDRSPREVQARFLAVRGLLDKAEIRVIPKQWLAPTKPVLTVIKGDINE